MNISESIEAFKALQRKMHAFGHAESVLYYDSVTVAPRGSAEGRGDTFAILSEESYRLFANEKTDELLSTLAANPSALDAQTAREVRVLREEFDKISKIPVEEYSAYAKLVNDAESAWHGAKEKNDYPAFEPYLARLIETKKRFASYYDPKKAPYDVYLDEHEKGLTTTALDSYFSALKSDLVPLIASVAAAKRQPSDAFLHASYPVEGQKLLSEHLMRLLTIDPAHCVLGESEHPFTLELNKNDVRITTHYHENNLASSLYSVVHEGGHALYELHVGDEYQYGALSGGISMGVHESQSRFFENIVGRSPEFCALLLPKLRELFPVQLAGVDERTLYEAVNRVTPSLIRTEADELTYSLHVMVRYEIEKLLFDGSVTTRELPALWNKLYADYLGVAVPDDTHGLLQDSHWSGGMFGYFPSYSIGSAYAAQLLSVMEKELPVFSLVREGTLAPIVAWLTDKIYRHGCFYEPGELMEKAFGAPFDPSHYTRYLAKKAADIYGM